MIAVEIRKLESVFLFRENQYMWPSDGEYNWRIFLRERPDMTVFWEVGPIALVRWGDE